MYVLPPKSEHFTVEWHGYLELCLPLYLSTCSWFFAVILLGVYDIFLFFIHLKIYSSQSHKTWEESLHLTCPPIHRLNTQHQEAVGNLVKALITVGNISSLFCANSCGFIDLCDYVTVTLRNLKHDLKVSLQLYPLYIYIYIDRNFGGWCSLKLRVAGSKKGESTRSALSLPYCYHSGPKNLLSLLAPYRWWQELHGQHNTRTGLWTGLWTQTMDSIVGLEFWPWGQRSHIYSASLMFLEAISFHLYTAGLLLPVYHVVYLRQ